MQKYLTLVLFFISTAVSASLKEDYDSINKALGMTPYIFINQCSFVPSLGCDQGIIRSSWRWSQMDLDDIISYRKGGAFLYVDASNGLKFEHYKKFCEFKSIDKKSLALKAISTDSYYRKIDKKEALTGNLRKYEQSEYKPTRLTKWKRKALKLLNSDKSTIQEAFKAQKFKNPEFTIDGEYISTDLELTLNPENALEKVQFFCNVNEIGSSGNILNSIRTPLKSSIKDEMLLEKNKIRDKRKKNFSKISSLKKIEELKFEDFKANKVKLKKDEWENCEQYLPRAINFIKETKKIGAARVSLNYDLEKELLSFGDIILEPRNPSMTIGDQWFYQESFNEKDKSIRIGKTENSRVLIAHLKNLRKEILSLKKNRAKKELKDFEAFVLFEYWENEFRYNANRAGADVITDLFLGNVISYGVRENKSREWVYQEGSNYFGLRLKENIKRGECTLKDSFLKLSSLENAGVADSDLYYFIED